MGSDRTTPEAPDAAEIRAAIRVLERASIGSIQQFGFHFQRNDYYSPLNDCAFLAANRDLWTHLRVPAAIDWRLEAQLETARVVGEFVEELRDVPDERPAGPLQYCWRNDFWGCADALVQYGLIRHRKPSRVVEVGCGWSSLLLERALAANGTPCAVTQVEPHPNAEIFARLPKAWTHYQTLLQRVPFEVFEALDAGDVLFYDGSHCAKTASDVVWFFFEVLPRIRPGVLVHLHDVFFPDDYPESWIFERGQTWNEQFVLQAFLMHNNAYRIVIANRFLWRARGADLDRLYRGVQPSIGCSIWLEKVAR